MKIIINDNQTVLLPKTWSEVNIDKFQQIVTIREKEHADDKEFIIELIEIFSEEKVLSISVGHINDSKIHFLKLFESKINEEIITEFRIGMKKYYLELDLHKIDTSLFADADFIIEQEGYWPSFHKVLAIFVREKNVFQWKNILKEYNSDDLELRAIKFKECLSINQVMGISVFFYHFVRTYINVTRAYSGEKKMDQMKIQK